MTTTSNTPPVLTPNQGETLVTLARHTLMERLDCSVPEDQATHLAGRLKDPDLQVLSGTFVTLRIGADLRGCIGSLKGSEPLVDGVRTNAVNAAFHDPRFRPLKSDELDEVRVEVSVLTCPQAMSYADADELVAKLRPRVDGVTIRKGFAGATFLPQVWEQLPKTEVFLSHLCTKAGLAADAWQHGDLEIETYQVQYFEESV